MHTNTWSDYSSYISDKSLIVGFTNRFFQYKVINDRVEFAKILKLNYRNIIIPKQIHSNKVSICSEIGQLIDTDGIITDNKDFILSIQVADCIPIYIYDTQKQNIGLVHAGWRGIASCIVENSINKMKNLDSKANYLKVLLGPSIRQCCFEIGPKVGKLFDAKYQEIGKNDKTYLDLQSVVIDKLINMKIPNENIMDVKECTCCSGQYHSFRRDSDKAGRMIAMMGRRS